MSDWSGPPASANYLAFGYTAVQNDVLVLYGWLFDVSQRTPANAQVLGKRYLGSHGRSRRAQSGARIRGRYHRPVRAANPCSAPRSIFVSNRTGHKEIWMMDPDGSNQQQITHFNSLSIEPAVSPDGIKNCVH